MGVNDSVPEFDKELEVLWELGRSRASKPERREQRERISGVLSAHIASSKAPVKQPSVTPVPVSRRSSAYGLGLFCAGILLAVVVPQVWKNITSVSVTTTSREYVTRKGQRAKVQLPDGSSVVMAPDTRIQYVSSKGIRRISLKGQAYFTVIHDVQNTFVVKTGSIDTRVLGTSFSVRSYSTDQNTIVAVAEGKVAIGAKAPLVTLVSGDVANVKPGQQPVITHDAKTADVFGWMNGQLHFDLIPLSDVVIELERLYDIDIRIANKELAGRKVVASFMGESVDKVLQSLSSAVDMKYRKDGRTVVLTTR